MALEIEAKVRVEKFDGIRRRLRERGARRLGIVSELNLQFECADARARRRLRLRLAEPVDDGGPSETTLTFKGKRIKSVLKSRPEIEVSIRDSAQMQQLLSAIGYRLQFQYEKRRETWALGRCIVALDDLPLLGSFVEVEAAKERDVFKTLRVLGLESQRIIRRGYSSMLRRHLRREGLNPSGATFTPIRRTG